MAPIVVVVTKESPDAEVGLGLVKINGQIVVSTIVKGGLFDGTELKVGMNLISINGVDTKGMDLVATVTHYSGAEDQVSIVAHENK